MTSYTDDALLARALAGEAGELLLGLRAGPLTGAQLRDAGDAAAQELLATRLAEHRPDDVVLSEEAPDPQRRLAASRVWIVDPLDGTREFGEPGRSDWAVHIALWADGELVAGAVAVPALGEVFGTDRPPVRPSRPGGPLRIVVSRTRPPAFATAMAIDLGAQLVPMGSAGAKAAAVWRGDVDAYLNTGGLHEWDAAAPVAVALAAGLHASAIDGGELEYNRPVPTLPDLVLCTPEVAEPILAWTARHSREVIQR
jgi:3'(2'), 5'-bisphosphate nucleotidase